MSLTETWAATDQQVLYETDHRDFERTADWSTDPGGGVISDVGGRMNKNARDWTFAAIMAVFAVLCIIGFNKIMWVVTAP